MKKVVGQIKLQIPAGKATPAPPVGPALGQHGVNIMDFCKNFNARTAKDDGIIIPVVITVYEDRSYTFITKTPPVAVLLKSAAGSPRAPATPNKNKVGKMTREAGGGDRQDEAARPQLHDAGGRHAHRQGHRPLHGRRSRLAQRPPGVPAPATGGQVAQLPKGGAMGRPGKKYAKAREVVDKPPTHWTRPCHRGQGSLRQVRRDRRDGHAPGRRPQARRPDGARHGGPAPRPRRQDQARAGHRRAARRSRRPRTPAPTRGRRRAGGQDPGRRTGWTSTPWSPPRT